MLALADTEKTTSVVCVGSKGANPMKRLQGEKIEVVMQDYSKNAITFAMVR
jgi:hypothetical protein